MTPAKAEKPQVDLRFDEEIAVITLDRPGGNRINFAMRREILEAVRAVANSDARALLVTAAGEDFSLGGDAAEWAGIPSRDLQPLVAVYATALHELENLPIPTVAVIQGRCRGGGFELALSCDFICAAAGANFAFPESQLGIITLQGGVLQLADRIGRTRALEMTTVAQPVGAAKLHGWNVVNWVVDGTALTIESQRIGKLLASRSSQAFAATKALLKLAQFGGTWAARDQLYPISMPLFDTQEVQTALIEAAQRID